MSDKNDFDNQNQNREAAKNYSEEAVPTTTNYTHTPVENKKILAGILAIIFGYLGIHKLILGYYVEGIIMASVFFIGCFLMCILVGYLFFWIPGLIGLIEGIIYLTKTDEEFYNTYQVGSRPWF